MKCVESLGKRDFTLDEVYSFERHLSDLYPGICAIADLSTSFRAAIIVCDPRRLT
jgi:hypothetical protein